MPMTRRQTAAAAVLAAAAAALAARAVLAHRRRSRPATRALDVIEEALDAIGAELAGLTKPVAVGTMGSLEHQLEECHACLDGVRGNAEETARRRGLVKRAHGGLAALDVLRPDV